MFGDLYLDNYYSDFKVNLHRSSSVRSRPPMIKIPIIKLHNKNIFQTVQKKEKKNSFYQALLLYVNQQKNRIRKVSTSYLPERKLNKQKSCTFNDFSLFDKKFKIKTQSKENSLMKSFQSNKSTIEYNNYKGESNRIKNCIKIYPMNRIFTNREYSNLRDKKVKNQMISTNDNSFINTNKLQ